MGPAARALRDAVADLRTPLPCTQRPDAVFDRPARTLARIAVWWCAECPVQQLCGAAGEENREVWGVWGGLDRTHRGAAR